MEYVTVSHQLQWGISSAKSLPALFSISSVTNWVYWATWSWSHNRRFTICRYNKISESDCFVCMLMFNFFYTICTHKCLTATARLCQYTHIEWVNTIFFPKVNLILLITFVFPHQKPNTRLQRNSRLLMF